MKTITLATILSAIYFCFLGRVIAQSKNQFNVQKDILLVQFDCKTDVDDIHTMAALATLLSHPDYSGVRYHAVAGTYGTQGGLYVPPNDLMQLAFGTNWTDAHENFDAAVAKVKKITTNILAKGGDIWIAEAGQSDFSATVIRSLQPEFPQLDFSKRIHIVQHSDWNEKVTSPESLEFVKKTIDYQRIPDGNALGNGTPGFFSPKYASLKEDITGGKLQQIWQLAVDIANKYNNTYGRYNNGAVEAGGVDFSDLSEVCWILAINHIENSEQFFKAFGTAPQAVPNKRLIVLTDITNPNWKQNVKGAEPDDYQSLIRLMYYANEFDIEGLVATSSCWLVFNEVDRSTQTSYIDEIIETYGKIRQNLNVHSSGYPTTKHLFSCVKSGNDNGMEGVGKGKSTEGSELIVEALKKDDNRPVWVIIWGGASTLAQALWDIKTQTDEEITRELVSKLRVYDIAGQDNAGAWITHTFPEIFYIRSQTQYEGISPRYDKPNLESNQPRRGGDESCVSEKWLEKNIMSGHGELAESYPSPRYALENDSPSLLYLINNGLSNPEFPHYGSWGGRFKPEKVKNPEAFFTDIDEVKDLISGKKYEDYFMYSDAKDHWFYDGVEYNSIYTPVARWRSDFQNDFAARLDWGVSEKFIEANHMPVVKINGQAGKEIIEIEAKAGSSISLDASSTSDPDGDDVYFSWWMYKEASTNVNHVSIQNPHHHTAKLEIDKAAPSNSKIHVVLTVKDDGIPQLTSYRRVIISVK